MTALNSLVRVHDWVLNEKRQKLSQLDEMADKLRNDLVLVEQDMERERTIASNSLEGTVAFPSFIAAALERRRRLRESIGNLEITIEAAREEVHEAFQEVKKYELARDNDTQREDDKRSRRDQADMDELGIGLYRRNRALDSEQD